MLSFLWLYFQKWNYWVYGSSIFNFLRTLLAFFPLLAAPVYKGSLFSTSTPAFLFSCRFDDSHSNSHEMISHCGFNLHFSDNCWYWACFHVLVDLSYIFFGETSIQFCCPFLNWIACCFVLSCISFSYIMDISPLSNTCAVCQVLQLCPTLWDLMDCSPQGSSILQDSPGKNTEWVAMLSSRGSSWPRDRTQVSHIAGIFFTVWVTRETQIIYSIYIVWKYLFQLHRLSFNFVEEKYL